MTDCETYEYHRDMHTHRRMLLMSSALGMRPLIQAFLPNYKHCSMAFVPTASYAESYGVISRMMQWYWRALGIDVRLVDLNMRQRSKVIDELRRADIIYVCGGNTFYLMKCLEDCGAVEVIREQVARGIPYLGESAGAVVASHNIDYIALMDSKRVIPRESIAHGLGLTGYCVVPHVGSPLLGKAAQQILQRHAHNHAFIGLHNDQALVITGSHAQVITNNAVLPLLV